MFAFALLSSHFQVKPTHSLHTTTDKLSRHCVICTLCVNALLSKFIAFPSEAHALHVLQGPCVCPSLPVLIAGMMVSRSFALSCPRVVWWRPVHHYVGRCYCKCQRARGGRRGHQQLRWFVRTVILRLMIAVGVLVRRVLRVCSAVCE